MASDRAPAPALNRGQAPDLGFQARGDHDCPSRTGGDGARTRAARSADTAGRTTSNETARDETTRGRRKAVDSSWWSRMPPPCQRPPTPGYPDASLSRAPEPYAGDRHTGVRHGAAGPDACAGSAAPPHADCSAAPLCCTPSRSSDCPDRTMSTGRPPGCTGRTKIAGNPDAPPDLLGLDTGAKTGHDLPARSASSRLTRATGSCHRRSPSPACSFVSPDSPPVTVCLQHTPPPGPARSRARRG